MRKTILIEIVKTGIYVQSAQVDQSNEWINKIIDVNQYWKIAVALPLQWLHMHWHSLVYALQKNKCVDSFGQRQKQHSLTCLVFSSWQPAKYYLCHSSSTTLGTSYLPTFSGKAPSNLRSFSRSLKDPAYARVWAPSWRKLLQGSTSLQPEDSVYMSSIKGQIIITAEIVP